MYRMLILFLKYCLRCSLVGIKYTNMLRAFVFKVDTLCETREKSYISVIKYFSTSGVRTKIVRQL